MKNRKIEYITGSWFPTSFHGHFRSKSRNEFTVPYREYAKPSPPEKFLDRSKSRSTHHLFSKHDNRHSHSQGMGDLEIHFNMHLGKRKPVDSQHSKNTSALLHWDSENTCSTYGSNDRSSCNNQLSSSSMNAQANQEKNKQYFQTVSTVPIHSRTNHNLQRLLIEKQAKQRCISAPPLLAWADYDNNDNSYFKPCVGDSTKRIIPKIHSDSRMFSTGSIAAQRLHQDTY